MIVISYGIPKSGSTLAFEMARAVFDMNGFSQERLDHGVVGRGTNINFVHEWSDERLLRLIESTRGRRVVVKTHREPNVSPESVLELMDAGDLKIQVVYRDPRDTIVSMLDQGVLERRIGAGSFRSVHVLEDGINVLGRHVENLRQWGSFPSLKLRYEDFAFDPTAGPSMIAEALGLPVDPAEVWEVVDRRFTQRNVARPERYKTELSIDEIARIERAFPLYLDVVAGKPPVGWFARPG